MTQRTQQLALDEIKANQPPIVLMPIYGISYNQIDNMSVDFKYYMITEYIYENYTPLVRLANFDVYSLKSKKDTYLRELNKKKVLQNTIYSGDFKNVDLKEILNHETTVGINEQGYLRVEVNGEDPSIVANIAQLIGNNHGFRDYDNNAQTKIKIDYEATMAGNLHLFYTLNDNEDFSETQSEIRDIKSTNENYIEIQLPSMPKKFKIVIDTPDVTLKGINITQSLEIIDEQSEVWTRDVGDIPMLWAELDGSSMSQNSQYLKEPLINSSQLSFDTKNINKSQPMYLLLQIESEENYRASIEIGSERENKLGVFMFNISKGKHDYAIRLSTDLKWWNNEAEFINLKTNGGVSIRKFTYYAEKENEYFNVDQHLMLSSITDENWDNGVGRGSNTLLFDNNSYNLRRLQLGENLIFNDGREISVTSISIFENYIHVEVNEDVNKYKSVASFPNSINVKN